MKRLVILASGNGSLTQAIIDAVARGDLQGSLAIRHGMVLCRGSA